MHTGYQHEYKNGKCRCGAKAPTSAICVVCGNRAKEVEPGRNTCKGCTTDADREQQPARDYASHTEAVNAANQPPGPPKHVDLTGAQAEALQHAEMVFWSIIASHFPQAKTGDLAPEMSIKLYATMREAVHAWHAANVPAFEPLPDEREQ